MVLIDMSKPKETRVSKLPHVVKFNYWEGAPGTVTARFVRKGQSGCHAKASVVSQTSKSITVELGTDLAKLGHGKYSLQLLQGCEVCAEECIFLDYSCAEYDTEHTEPQKFKEKACG